MADRPLLQPASAVRLLHAARAVAASSCRSRSGAARGGLACSPSSTVSTGLRPSRRRCGSTEDAFGRENTGVIYGWIGASHQLGASIAAFGAGAIRTLLGDYRSRSGSRPSCACSPGCPSSPSGGARSNARPRPSAWRRRSDRPSADAAAEPAQRVDDEGVLRWRRERRRQLAVGLVLVVDVVVPHVHVDHSIARIGPHHGVIA